MPIISQLERRSWPGRLLTAAMYVVLTTLAVTMVTPFLITAAGSISNSYDYERFRPLPRYLYSRTDRFVKGLVRFFDRYPRWYEQMGARFEAMPSHWASWRDIGRDQDRTDALAADYLRLSGDDLEAARRIAADYADFVAGYPLVDQVAIVSDIDASSFLADRYELLWRRTNTDAAATAGAEAGRKAALQLLGDTWGLPLASFYVVGFDGAEMRQPYWQQSWYPALESAKYRDFLLIKRAAAYHVFTPGIESKWRDWAESRSEGGRVPSLVELVELDDPDWQARWLEFKRRRAPAAPVQPHALRTLWRRYLDTSQARRAMGLAPETGFSVEVYNRLAGTRYTHLNQTPFPLPADAPEVLRGRWRDFVLTRYPIRLTRITPDSGLTRSYRDFLRERFKTLDYANRMLETRAASWEEFELFAEAPAGPGTASLRSVWIDFVKGLPLEQRRLQSAEQAYQEFLGQRYGSPDRVNAEYGWDLDRFEEAFPPFDIAYTVTFLENEWSLSLLPIVDNYRFVLTFLFERGRAVVVTLVLVGLAILASLTINPMAAYALSRFSMAGKDKVILFLLSTMAFPTMVSAIPAYLLMRDLGLLNTFFALVLPSATNGMAIFILKGFFDSLPRELYEAATIDGAREWQIFLVITMPMMKPILAINALSAFIMAYNSWEWALIICQRQSMWTLSVWMYQLNQWWSLQYPWLVMAGFVVVSIPTLVVFGLCQKIIMRGIIIPSMK